MNLSMKWLNDYVKIDMPIKEFADGMTMSGSKVEKYKKMSEPLEKIVIGYVKEIERHTDSEKLWVAQVEIGDGSVQIVTGAQNVFKGAYVPVVLEGGTVIDRHNKTAVKIKKGKLRGVESCGMMCSIDELGLEACEFPYADTDGILILNKDPMFSDDVKAGMDAVEFLGLDDISVEFEITNNRPDCLAVLGLAREAGATFNLPFETPAPKFKGTADKADLDISIENSDICSRYMAAVVKNVKIGQSPRFITERLRASGVRPINNFVDITNYVMLEYGHPMHAFDKKYIAGGKIIVRNAKDGEEITLLDGSKQKLSPDMPVIADAEKPIAVAGVMGGEFSGIMTDTETVVFESACFDGVTVRRAAKKVGRRTDASARFEKGLDPENAKQALYRALELIEALGCGEVAGEIIDVYVSKSIPKKVPHDYKRINEILGADISEAEQTAIFQRLGFGYDSSDKTVTPPSVRIDIELECDLAEEVARIYGYNEIKSTVPSLGTEGKISDYEKFIGEINRIMLGSGCNECLTFSFISPKAYGKAGIDEETANSVVIKNPLGEDTGVMRTTMLPSMLDVIGKNSRKTAAGRFYEIGRVYVPNANSLPNEEKILSIGVYGAGEDFFTIKGIVEELLEKTGIQGAIKFTPVTDKKTFHPGRTAEITANGVKIGIFGEINPQVRENHDIGGRAYIAEISAEKLYKSSCGSKKYKPLPKYPAMTRDLSIVCDEDTASGSVMEIIQKAGKNVEQITFFDMYKGEQVPCGKKSLSYKLTLRKSDGTLTDEDADRIMAKIISALGKENMSLRN